MSVASLPDLNVLPGEALRALILVQHEQLLSAEDRLTATQEQLQSREREIEHLQLLLAKLHRMQFGRKSEKLQRQIEQLELRLEELESHRSEKECNAAEPAPVIASSTPAAAKPTRRALPDHLPRQTRRHEPKETVCPQCQGELRKLGEDASEMLEYVPASFVVIRHVRTKLSCTKCDCIVQAEAPSRPIERGVAGPGLLAHVLVSKYCDHLPLYRQSEMYARQDVELERSTLAAWVGSTSRLLEPLVEALRRYVMAAGKLHADDTPVPVLAPGNGKTKTGRLWTYVRDDRPAGDATAPAVWFAYSPDRKGEHPERHLEKFRGTLQADAYAGFNQLYENGRIEQAACWAHVRRKFYDLEQAHASPVAREALVRIGALYGIEETIRGRPPERTSRGPPGAVETAARLFATVVRGELVETVAQIGDHGGDSLRPLPLGRVGALYRRWTHRDRQQRRRTIFARRGPGPELCAVRDYVQLLSATCPEAVRIRSVFPSWFPSNCT